MLWGSSSFRQQTFLQLQGLLQVLLPDDADVQAQAIGTVMTIEFFVIHPFAFMMLIDSVRPRTVRGEQLQIGMLYFLALGILEWSGFYNSQKVRAVPEKIQALQKGRISQGRGLTFRQVHSCRF